MTTARVQRIFDFIEGKQVIFKVCNRCGKVKPVSEFPVRRDTKGGYRAVCKECQKEIQHENYLIHAEERKAKQRQWNATHKESKKEYGHKWHQENLEKARESNKKWALNNPEKIKEMGRNWAKKNPEKIKERAKRWREKHPDRAKEIACRGSKKIWNSPNGRLNGIMSSAIRRSLKGAKARKQWEDLVGYSLNDLRTHLEKKFKPLMLWDNQGKVWEIDHIIPLKYFNFQNSNQIAFKEAWKLQNLQPLYKSENRHKSAKLNKPLQLMLCI
jgi:hypothetical protein